MVDREGFYHHCGRVDDLFKVGGKWVSPSRGRARADRARRRVGVRGDRRRRRRGPDQAARVRRHERRLGRRPEARGRAQGVRQEVARAVQVPALDRVRRGAAARPRRQAAALQAAPAAPPPARRDRHRATIPDRADGAGRDRRSTCLGGSACSSRSGRVAPTAPTGTQRARGCASRARRCRRACARSIRRGSSTRSQLPDARATAVAGAAATPVDVWLARWATAPTRTARRCAAASSRVRRCDAVARRRHRRRSARVRASAPRATRGRQTREHRFDAAISAHREPRRDAGALGPVRAAIARLPRPRADDRCSCRDLERAAIAPHCSRHDPTRAAAAARCAPTPVGLVVERELRRSVPRTCSRRPMVRHGRR